MQPTLFLITSAHRGWCRLRTTLEVCPDIHLVGEVQCAAQAISKVARLQPAALLVAADVSDTPLVSLIQHLHGASPNSKIIVLGDEAPLERSTLLALGPLVAAYLMWADLRAETVPHCLSVVVEDNLVVGSRAVLEMHLNLPQCRKWPRDQALVLTTAEGGTWEISPKLDPTMDLISAKDGSPLPGGFASLTPGTKIGAVGLRLPNFGFRATRIWV